jgi:hypothetical protein
MTKKTLNERERQKLKQRLTELRLRPQGDGPRCFHCQNPKPPDYQHGLLCPACDGD